MAFAPPNSKKQKWQENRRHEQLREQHRQAVEAERRRRFERQVELCYTRYTPAQVLFAQQAGLGAEMMKAER